MVSLQRREKMVGCDFLSNTIKSITTNTLKIQ